ncbi:MAG: type II toxin-antitoxin system RelE/ParE family toxin [Desulfitobacterium hafniense]|nr:type II toxin-antitoxin system RelE/ParE family toxin [Desulfitobacterium hafniense]
MKFKIRINPVAISDVKEIIAYISEENPAAAERMGNDIYSKVEKLAEFPQMGVSLSSRINIKTDYRFLVCGMYLIFYKIEGEFVSVYRVLNGTRDYLSILFTDDLSEN